MNTLQRMKNTLPALLLAVLALGSCKKQTETLSLEPVSNYTFSRPGQYIIYRVDSTVVLSFGAVLRVNSYHEKHEVDATITDNTGRPSLRVFRYQRDTTGTGAWRPSGSYLVTAADNKVEVSENNMRFVKLAAPMREGFTWLGNRFLPTKAYSSAFEFSNDNYMDAWEYTYEDVDSESVINGRTYPGSVTVMQIDESINFPVTSQTYGTRNYAVEKYAKGIGMIYQELIMLEFQPPPFDRPGYRGFGVKRSIIAHN
jgi:hypothetical protein